MRSTLPTFNEVWQRQFRSNVLIQAQTFKEQSSYLIGCSGGVDSMLLLHLMSFLFPQKVRAIYVDHQLQCMSAAWGQFVLNTCQQLQVPCSIVPVRVAEGNLENQARNARYQAFAEHLQVNEVLVLAHHQQDQAETLMLRLLSGAGVQGLSAMSMVDVRAKMTLWRPMLELSREQICQWAAQLNVQNIEDPTNADPDYDRAWCRQILWPILEQRFPKMQQALTRTSVLMQDADEILLEVLASDLEKCGNPHYLNLEPLSALSVARQRQLLSHWMQGEATYRPNFAMVQRLITEVIEAKQDAQAALHWQGYYYVRYQQQIFRLTADTYLAEQRLSILPTQMQTFDLNQTVSVFSGRYLIQAQALGLSKELLGRPLILSTRAGGEKIHLYGRVGTWPLKKALQQAQIFPWLRHTIQILSIDNVMLGVFTPKGFWLAQSEYLVVDGWQPKLVSGQ
ncbi:tRNA lysidine(34) synthetase TilS [Acinetobacter sp. ANC 4173]|uniref:tRNA lysidine(34) synthetase TilS n=1 Tax=Acinetobacter sp. ANC 4173 TaxID=2529837 RepID=UPI00103B5C1F|nr:tRNA lysidine(34) synthetase TilS [Acinetobacter sp. ANC 4173]TCB78794.1 tRNA lysidine(34) synthetase TilS [Acinetobacter sp. ANC 4173]